MVTKVEYLNIIFPKYREAFDDFIESLMAKNAWKKLESKMLDKHKEGWANEKLSKIYQWERKAHEVYQNKQKVFLDKIISISKIIGTEERKSFISWIRNNKNSKKAWSLNEITINDDLELIEARYIQILCSFFPSDPKNVGKIIKK